MAKNKQYAVLGLDPFGLSIVKTLSQNGYSVMAVDSDYDILQEASQYATHVMKIDSLDEVAFTEIGLGNFDVVVVSYSNLDSSIIATTIAKENGASFVMSRAKSSMHKKILYSVGADRVVLPEVEIGQKMAMSIITTSIVEYINLSDEYTIAEIEPLDEWIGETVASVGVRNNHGLNIVAIKRNDDVIIMITPDEIICKGDVIVVIGKMLSLQRFGIKSNDNIKPKKNDYKNDNK